MLTTNHLNLSTDDINSFCHRWQITELALFGSVLREDFRPDSDIDMLVSFHPQAPWTLLDLVTMQQELESITGREVDLIEKKVIENSRNPIRRRNILDSAQVIYTDVYEPA
jgi:hypothetical protein